MTAVFGAPVLQEMEERLPPHDYVAEQQVIGAAVMRPALFDVLAEIVKPGYFADPVHGRIWELMAEGYAVNKPWTAVTINARFAGDPDYEGRGGSRYLTSLAAGVAVVLPAVIENYGRRIADLWLRREMLATLQEFAERLYDTKSADATTHIEALETHVAALTGDAVSDDNTAEFSMAIEGALRAMETAWKADGKLIGVTTGLTDLDAKLGGLHPSDLIILAGRPSMGKSALAQTIAEAAARSMLEAGKKGAIGFYSLEMSNEQLGMRSIAGASGISGHSLREGRISQDEARRAFEAGSELKALPIFIDDTGGLTVPQLRTRARRLKRRHGLALIIIDYLQLMRGTSGGREANRVQEVSEITRGLKALAKELDVPVLALSQLSREVEKREDKRPQLADLRESGSIEQDADVVMFVYREQYYLERAQPSRRPDESDDKFNSRMTAWEARCGEVWNTAEVIIGKQRHGPTGIVRTHFDGNLTKFGNLETHHHG